MCFYLLLTQVTSSHDLSPRTRPLTDWTCPDCNRILLSGLNFTEDELYHKMIWESQEVSFLNPYTNMVKLLVIGLSYSWTWFKRKQMKCFLNSHLLSNFQIYNHHIIFRIQSLILDFLGYPCILSIDLLFTYISRTAEEGRPILHWFQLFQPTLICIVHCEV